MSALQRLRGWWLGWQLWIEKFLECGKIVVKSNFISKFTWTNWLASDTNYLLHTQRHLTLHITSQRLDHFLIPLLTWLIKLAREGSHVFSDNATTFFQYPWFLCHRWYDVSLGSLNLLGKVSTSSPQTSIPLPQRLCQTTIPSIRIRRPHHFRRHHGPRGGSSQARRWKNPGILLLDSPCQAMDGMTLGMNYG